MTTQASEARSYATHLELRDVQAVGAGKPFTYLEGRAVPYATWADLGWFMEQHDAESFQALDKRQRGPALAVAFVP